ncbi:glycosyltransferase family 2 protein [Vibrio vulnificus]|nr:glycosyltransferase [Vibrio vulnificus]MCU8289865.1 glycosyltransferase [Vibrio vulnificus]
MNFNFICVNYNGFDFTKSLLESLELLNVPDGDSLALIIIDNNSEETDKINLRMMKSDKVHIKLIESPSNIGYFPAMNLGIDYARKNSHGSIVIGNNDLKYRFDFIEELKKLTLQSDILVVSPDVVTVDGVHQNPLSMKKLTRLQLMVEDLYYSNYYLSRFLINTKKFFLRLIGSKKIRHVNQYVEHEIIINRGIGACYFLTEYFFNHFDRLDDRVFMWGEEALLSHQVQSVNGKILYVPKLVVEHFESGTVKKMLTRHKYEIVRQSYKVYREYL